MTAVISRQELESAHCWEAADRVPGRPATTAFRRAARLHAARWRAVHGHPAGTHPIVPRPGGAVRTVGSRLPLDYAVETGATFLTPAALAAARDRTRAPEPQQSFDHQRLWADLLWSPALGFNLFGDLAADLALADRAVHAWWPDAPGRVCAVRFAHSRGRLDPAYLNSLRAFDATFVLDLDDGGQGVIGVDTRYQEWAKPEIPRPENRRRYVEVARRSGAFAPRVIESLTRPARGTPACWPTVRPSAPPHWRSCSASTRCRPGRPSCCGLGIWSADVPPAGSPRWRVASSVIIGLSSQTRADTPSRAATTR